MVIRVGIIGLSAAATGTGWAAAAHLPYLLKSPHYEIVALCNSTVDNAKAAIKAFNLPPETRAYGSGEELALDNDVDMVVANTRVDLHGKVLLPSLRAGKTVFSEWPMDGNLKAAKEMLGAARKSGSKTIVGLQGRANPVVQKVKQLVDEGRIGKVLSTHVFGFAGNGGAEEIAKIKYLVQREVGGNMLTIHFVHSESDPFRLINIGLTIFVALDSILFSLGEIDTAQSLLKTQIPEVKIIDGRDTKNYIETIAKTTPDQILLQATLKTGAVLSLHLQGGNAPPFDPQHLWRIHGEKGSIDVAADTFMLNIKTEGVKIRLYDGETGKVDNVSVDKDALDELPVPARNIGRVYEAFVAEDKNFLVTFEDAFERHKLLEKMLSQWDNRDQGWNL